MKLFDFAPHIFELRFNTFGQFFYVFCCSEFWVGFSVLGLVLFVFIFFVALALKIMECVGRLVGLSPADLPLGIPLGMQGLAGVPICST